MFDRKCKYGFMNKRNLTGNARGLAVACVLGTGMALLFAFLSDGLAKECVAGQPGEPAVDLGEFWPLNAPPRKWNLISSSAIHSAHPEIRMTVENETVKPGEFILWFSNKKGQATGKRDGEHYRLCKTAGSTWLYLDAYIDSSPGKQPIRHDVISDRILFSPSDGVSADLIGDGNYRACGAIGQPYLLWSGTPASYRIQVWGHLTENARFRWYWDATVTKSNQVVNDCLEPGKKIRAVRVQEAWWSNFKDPSGAWELGNGSIDPHEGTPSGSGVAYGRTVWHGAGQLPYLMIWGSHSATGSTWCVNEIVTHREK